MARRHHDERAWRELPLGAVDETLTTAAGEVQQLDLPVVKVRVDLVVVHRRALVDVLEMHHVQPGRLGLVTVQRVVGNARRHAGIHRGGDARSVLLPAPFVDCGCAPSFLRSGTTKQGDSAMPQRPDDAPPASAREPELSGSGSPHWLGLGGRVCVVTGAARGIGLAIAERLAAEGGRVAWHRACKSSLHAHTQTCCSRTVVPRMLVSDRRRGRSRFDSLR